RSPVTPKITSALGPAMRLRRRSSGSRSGLTPREISTVIDVSLFLLGCFEERQDLDLGVGQGEGDDGTSVIFEDLRIACGLSAAELAEGEGQSGDLEVDVTRLQYLEEDSLGRPALVELACRVEE